MPATEPFRATRQLGPLLRLDSFHLVLGQVGFPHHGVVDHPHPALTDGAESQFGLKRHPQLAHHQHIQRRGQCPGDLEGHRHPTARQAQHDNVLAAQ